MTDFARNTVDTVALYNKLWVWKGVTEKEIKKRKMSFRNKCRQNVDDIDEKRLWRKKKKKKKTYHKNLEKQDT